MHRYVAFDIEIRKEIPEGEDDWKARRPLGISCAATLTSDGEERIWHGGMCTDWASFEMLPSQMAPEECREMACYLQDLQESGYPVLTWNGLGFDFDILAEETQDPEVAALLREAVMNHIDIAFAMMCERGFMCGLDAAAKGMGLSGKIEGMTGSLAPVMWAQERVEQDRVLEYVLQDIYTTVGVYEAILERSELVWITKAGSPTKRPWRPTLSHSLKRLLTVEEALKLPLPNTSWMHDPWSRSKFCGWLDK